MNAIFGKRCRMFATHSFTNFIVRQIRPILIPKSLYRSRAGRHFYETENEIWAGWHYWGLSLATFEGSLFQKNIVASALKSCIISLL